jgi:hydrogenase expression/formation protein HypD
MRFIDEYRDSSLLLPQLQKLRRLVTRRWVVMDVCGGQTHSFLRSGLESALEDVVELVHGPGCPVCVTPSQMIDDALQLARRDGMIVATFGDMLRVPGTSGSLMQARSVGADIRTMYSPMDAVSLAQKEPNREIVFLAVGFETTVPATALAVRQAARLGLNNFSLLAHHVRVEPAMRAVLKMPDNRVQGFLAAGHVCTVTGYQDLNRLVDDFHVPIIVTGFEPLDLLLGLTDCVRSLEQNEKHVRNLYPRAVEAGGNLHALNMIDSVYEIASVPWRGMGTIQDGGLVIRSKWSEFDARVRYGLGNVGNKTSDHDSWSAVVSGRLKPRDCPLFGNKCTPDHPVGVPMVSSEGACAAYFRYAGQLKEQQ